VRDRGRRSGGTATVQVQCAVPTCGCQCRIEWWHSCAGDHSAEGAAPLASEREAVRRSCRGTKVGTGDSARDAWLAMLACGQSRLVAYAGQSRHLIAELVHRALAHVDCATLLWHSLSRVIRGLRGACLIVAAGSGDVNRHGDDDATRLAEERSMISAGSAEGLERGGT